MDKKRKGEKKQEEINLKKENEQLKKQLEDYKNRYLRSLADYQNLEKRVLEEKKEFQKTANKNLLLKMITVLDDIDKAEIFVKDNGLVMIKNRFYQILQEEGVKEIEVLGKKFNPHLAEAIEVVEGEKDNVVVEVIRKGYYYFDKILRPAQVKVSKLKRDKEEEEKAKEQLFKGDYL